MLLLALQFCSLDRKDAFDLLSLVTDLQPAFCLDADLLLMGRYDEPPPPPEIIQRAARKFNVHHAIAKRRGQGWPFGTSQLWLSVLDWIYGNQKAGKIPRYDAVLTFEPDSCPLSSDWISRLNAGWNAAQPAKVYGPILPSPVEHVNGNAFFSCDEEFLYWITRKHRGIPPHHGWDTFLAAEFKKRGWADAPMMRSWWNCRNCSEQKIQAVIDEGVCFLHGVKTDQVRKFVRKNV